MKFLQKTFLTGLFSLFLFGNATTQAQSFADVSSDHPYYEAIEYAKNNNIVKGYNNGLFSPFKTINRAEFTKIIIGSLYSEEEISSCDTEKFSFPDVKNSDWFAKYVCVAKKEKIINGYADGTFKASNTITLPEAMKIILEGNEIDVMEGYNESYNSGKTICDTCSQLIIDVWSENWASPYIHYFVKNIDEKEEKLEKRIFGAAQAVGEEFFIHKISRGEMAYIIMKIKNE